MPARKLPKQGTEELNRLVEKYETCHFTELPQLAKQYNFKSVGSFVKCMRDTVGAKRKQVRTLTQPFSIIEVDLTMHEFIYLIPLADLHIGSPWCNLPAIQGYLDWIKAHRNAYTLLNGDIINAAWKESTPELYEDLLTPDQAYEQATQLLKPIKNKILAIADGGHELSIFHTTGTDYGWHLAKELGIENRFARDGGVLSFQLKPLSKLDYTQFQVLFTHGWGGARTRGAKIKKVEDLTRNVDADVYVLSHDHTSNLTRDNYLQIMPDTSVKVHRKMMVSTGGFLSYGGYVFRKGLTPQDLGTPRIRIGKRLDEETGLVRPDVHASL